MQVGPCIPVEIQLEKAEVGPTFGPTWGLSHFRALALRQGSEKDAELAQKLGQLQPVIAVFPQERVGQLASFGPT